MPARSWSARGRERRRRHVRAGGRGAGPTADEPAARPAERLVELIAAEAVEDEIKSSRSSLPRRSKIQRASRAAAIGRLAALERAGRDVRHRAPNTAGGSAGSAKRPPLRDLVARAGFNCAESAPTRRTRKPRPARRTYNCWSAADRLSLPAAAAQPNWPKVADRPSADEALEQAQQQVLTADGQTASSTRTSSGYHEAQIVAALAEVITREGYRVRRRRRYVEYAQPMRAAGACGPRRGATRQL